MKYYFCLQMEQRSNGIFVNQKAYIKKVFKCFNFDHVRQLSTSMVIRYLNTKNDQFRSKGDEFFFFSILEHHS